MVKSLLRSALSRRAALGRIIGGAALAPVIAQDAARSATHASIGQSLMGFDRYGGAPVSDSGQSVDWILKRPLRLLYNQRDAEATERLMWRLGPFDPDIACLESVSYGQRCRMQRTRDRATKSVLDDLRKQLGWTE